MIVAGSEVGPSAATEFMVMMIVPAMHPSLL
jgi:hypothetical protein